MAKKSKQITVYVIMHIILFIRMLFLIPRGICKYQPSCTVYAREALLNQPLHKAIFLIIKRVIRCNPFSKGGNDPLAEI